MTAPSPTSNGSRSAYGRIMVLGGYGNFGKRIASALALKGIGVIVAGRNQRKAEALAATLKGAQAAAFDAQTELASALENFGPVAIVNTCGPFQTGDYAIANACIGKGVHYLDLADGRDFVVGISTLDAAARSAGVAVVSGASTVPGLSSAILDRYQAEFAKLERIRFGISPGQKAERGLATTKGIMTYVGKPLHPFPGAGGTVYGWQDLYRQDYPGLGKRWMANCDIPDLDLFAERYGINNIRFSAGLELSVLHLGLWALSWLVRLGLPLDLPKMAPLLLTASNWFNSFGSGDGGLHMIMEGTDRSGNLLKREWYIIARDGDGPHIPTIPAILLAERAAHGEPLEPGARPCVGMVSLEDYLAELSGYNIETVEL